MKMMAGNRFGRADRWFWATVAAAAVPVAVVGTVVALGTWMPGTDQLFAACGRWAATPAGQFASVVLGALVAYPLVQGVISAVRRIGGTRRWLHLLRYTAAPRWPGAYWAPVVQVGLEGRVELCDLPLSGAWTVGLWHPRIVVTTLLLQALSPQEFAAVLYHEACHLRSRHPLKAVVVGVLRDAFGWFPAVSASAATYAAARELAADANAARYCGKEVLRSALLKCGEAPAVAAPFGAPAFTDLMRLRLARLGESGGACVLSAPTWAWLQSAVLALLCSALGAAACGTALR